MIRRDYTAVERLGWGVAFTLLGICYLTLEALRGR